MSETDDTDDLLLIPPDFFLIDSEQEDSIFNKKSRVPYYTIVDSLITQVNKLENRLNYIQCSTDTSLVSIDSSLDVSDKKSNLMYGIRKINSSDDIQNLNDGNYISSTQSTPQKPRSRFHLSSLPNSPNINRYSPRKTVNSHVARQPQLFPSKISPNNKSKLSNVDKNEKKEILGEIDTFISNVKTIQRINAARNLTNDFEQIESQNQAKTLNIIDIDNMLKELEVASSSKDSLINNNKKVEDYINKHRTWQSGDNISSVPDYGSGMRSTMYNNENIYTKLTVTPLNSKEPSTSDISTFNESVPENKSVSISSSESSHTTALYNVNKAAAGDASIQNSETIHSNAIHVLNKHKKLLGNSKNTSSKIGSDLSNLTLVSLKDLWSQNFSDLKSINPIHVKCLQKLEEEKLRRQHCEQLIQQLQTRTLELQERLAVAVQVDQAKDQAISRFNDVWEKISTKINTLNKEKIHLENQISGINEKNQQELNEALQKAQHYEAEASKALNLAHNNQEKLANVEGSLNDLKNSNNLLQIKLEETQKLHVAEIEKNKQLSELIAQKEIELSECKNVLSEARKEIAQSKRAVEVCQAEFTTMKTECEHFQLSLNEERERVSTLEKQKKKLLTEIDSHKKIEKNLQDDLNKTREQNDQNKIELRNFYQDQVEAVVREKLQEFQTQLNRAESALQEELKNREMSLARTAGLHIQQLSEKHSLEVQLLEEKHSEEVRLYKLQLSQSQQQIENMQHKLQQQQERRATIAQQLHKVMEAQWIEALRIINTGRSPVVTQNMDFSTIDQLNTLKSKSYTNLEELLLLHAKEEGRNIKPHLQSGDSMSSMIEDDGHNRFYQMPMDTPVTSRPQKSKQQQESDLQKYIQMLLNKSAGNSVEDKQQKDGKSGARDSPTNDRSIHWQTATNMQDELKCGKSNIRDKKFGKPPWK